MNRPKRPCKRAGCPGVAIRGSSYCADHATPRKTASERGYDSRWAKARVTYLRNHPLCWECEQRGYVTPATVVDHIIPHHGDQKLFWDPKNWQPLCQSCHNCKTAGRDGGFGNE